MIIWNRENLAGRQQPPLQGIDSSMLHRGNTSRSGFQMLCLMLMGMASEISYPALPLMAAEAIVSLKRSYPDIALIAAIPFKGQASRFSSYDQKRYDRLLEVADEVIVLSDCYYPRCFLDRDEFMVNNSSKLIGYYDGREKGGTFYTIRKAMAQNIPIVNVF